MNHLRMFGCLCYVHNQKHDEDKFASQSHPSVFVSYTFRKKGWRVYNTDIGVVSVSRDAIFIEYEFPFADFVTKSPSSSLSFSSVSLKQFFMRMKLWLYLQLHYQQLL